MLVLVASPTGTGILLFTKVVLVPSPVAVAMALNAQELVHCVALVPILALAVNGSMALELQYNQGCDQNGGVSISIQRGREKHAIPLKCRYVVGMAGR